LAVKTTCRKDNFNIFYKAKTKKLTLFEELQSAKNTLQSYPEQRLKK